jgi:ribosomal protein L11 methyltransferase
VYLAHGPTPSHFEAGRGEAFIGNWVEGRQPFLFFFSASWDEEKRLFGKMVRLVLIDEFRFTYDEWPGGGLSSTTIGPFLTHPPWLSVDPYLDAVHIVFDPGVVFGNGLHPTTRDCLLARPHIFCPLQCQPKRSGRNDQIPRGKGLRTILERRQSWLWRTSTSG